MATRPPRNRYRRRDAVGPTRPAVEPVEDRRPIVNGPIWSRQEELRADRAAAQRRRRTVLLTLLSAATAAALVGTDLSPGPLLDPFNSAGRAVAAMVGPAAPAAATRGATGGAVTDPGADAAAQATAADLRAVESDDPDLATDAAAPDGPVPSAGAGSFSYAPAPGPVAGVDGRLLRFRVAVEDGTGQKEAVFATAVDAILADPRGWTREGLRFQRVTERSAADFTIFLASPVTSESMCAAGGLRTEGYSSCRLPAQVIINSARWASAVADYGAPIAVYRAYAINHEVGHELGYGHDACPAPGRPAPVMQQQTYGLQGCTAYGWPYLDGLRYIGPPVP